MKTPKFVVGDKVRLKSTANKRYYYSEYGFSGSKDEEFTIIRIKEYNTYNSYSIRGHNWCKEEWLELVCIIYLGGE